MVNFLDNNSPAPSDPTHFEERLPSLPRNETVTPVPRVIEMITLSSDEEQNEPAENGNNGTDNFDPHEYPVQKAAPVANIGIRNEQEPVHASTNSVCYL